MIGSGTPISQSRTDRMHNLLCRSEGMITIGSGSGSERLASASPVLQNKRVRFRLAPVAEHHRSLSRRSLAVPLAPHQNQLQVAAANNGWMAAERARDSPKRPLGAAARI